jgi:hypothetical protein
MSPKSSIGNALTADSVALPSNKDVTRRFHHRNAVDLLVRKQWALQKINRLNPPVHISALLRQWIVPGGSPIASVSASSRAHARSFNLLGFMARTRDFPESSAGSAPRHCGFGQAKLKPNPARDDLAASKIALRRQLLQLFTSVRTLHEEEPEYPSGYQSLQRR